MEGERRLQSTLWNGIYAMYIERRRILNLISLMPGLRPLLPPVPGLAAISDVVGDDSDDEVSSGSEAFETEGISSDGLPKNWL